MSSKLIIGVDAGTSVIKAVAFDLEGKQVGVASVPNRVQLGADGSAEQDLDGTWADTATTLRLLAQQVPDLAQRVVALAATGQGDGTWLIDAQGKAVRPAMLWLDGRSAPQINALRNSPAAQAIAELTGTALNPSMQSGHLLWLEKHHSQVLQGSSTVFHCKDWLYFKATGERATTYCEGVFTFGNYRSGTYDDATLALLGLSGYQHLLPPMHTGSERTAPLTAQAAQDTGLRQGLPVILPAMDVPATLLGSGGVALDAQGEMRRVGCSILGSTGMHGWLTKGLDAIVPSAQAGYTMMMPLPDVRARLMSHMAATLNVDWLLNLVSESVALHGSKPAPRTEVLARLNQMVLDAPPAQAVYHPYIADNGERGPFVDPSARAQLTGFNTSLGLAGMARAVFEGIALAARDCYSALGPLPEEIRLSGGAARSPALRQLLADVTGCPVRVSHREECGAAGAALMAAVALGHYPSVQAALPQWVDSYLSQDMVQPDASRVAVYEQIFSLFQEMAARQRPSWQALQVLRGSSVFTSTRKSFA